MKKYIVDIETDGLLDTVSKVHLIVCKDVDTGELKIAKTPMEVFDLSRWLRSEEHCIIGHNVLGFDFKVLNKLYGLELSNINYIDTLILSRLVLPDLRARDFDARAMDSKLFGSHSLKAWGHRLDLHKGDYGEQDGAWDEVNEQMVEYCINDVELTHKLYDHLMDQKPSIDALELEQEIAHICYEQEWAGFPFDTDKAVVLLSKLKKRAEELRYNLVKAFGSWVVDEGERKKGLYHKISIIEFNPNSRQHISKRLQELHGWKPTEFTPSGEPKVDETVLSKLQYPEAKLMSEFLLIQKRIGQLSEGNQGWLKLERKGRLHGRVNTMGSITSRCSHSHPNLAQVPSVHAEYGKECRELFKVVEGYSLVGIDVSGLELRCLSHYMAKFDGGSYGRNLLDGDIHTANQKAAGLSTRDQAKTFIYGFLYGAGDAKVGQIVGKGPRVGRKLKEEFLNKLPALKKLREAVQGKAKKHGYVRGLDRRKVPVRSTHAALNTLLQSAGAIVCKKWLVILHELLRDKGYTYAHDYTQVAFVHDEVQLMVKEEHAERIGSLAVEAIGLSGEHYGFRIPLTGEFRVGRSWADTH